MATGKTVGKITRQKGKMYAVDGAGNVKEYTMNRGRSGTAKKKPAAKKKAAPKKAAKRKPAAKKKTAAKKRTR